MARPTPEPDPPERPSHPDVPVPPGRPGISHPDHDLPKPEPPVGQPKGRKAKDAIPATGLSQLLPASAAIGDPTFAVHLIGYGFTPASLIVMGGQDEETTYLSPTELATVVDMTVWLGPDPAVPVLVKTGGETTNSLDFAFTPARVDPLDDPSQPIPAVDLIAPV